MPGRPDAPVALLDDALPPEEVALLRQRLERCGFAAMRGLYPAGYRDNDRLVFDDPELARRLFAALAPQLPSEVTTRDGERAVLVGLNPRFRACRYRGGQSFQRHRDGAFAPTPDLRSERTLMFYLSDAADHEGGDTRFYRSADPREAPALRISPRAGTAAVFAHDLWHDGEPVTAGTKYVLRSDLLYRRVGPERRSRPGHRGYVWDVAPRGEGWLSVGRDGTLRGWRRGEGALSEDVLVTLDLPSPTACLALPSGELVVGSREGALLGLDAQGAPLFRVGPARGAHRGAVLALATSPSGFVSAGADGVLRVWTRQGEPLARRELRRGAFLHALVGLACPGQRGAAEWMVGGDHRRVHHLAFDGERLHECGRRALPAPVRALAHGEHEGTWVGLGDGRVVALRCPALPVALHAGAVTSLALLGDGRLLSGGEDGRVLLSELGPRAAGVASLPSLLSTRRDFVTRLLPAGEGYALVAGYDAEVALLRVPERLA